MPVAVIALALAIKLLIPGGAMIGGDARTLTVQICDGYADAGHAVVIAINSHADTGKIATDRARDHQACPFSALGHGGVAGAHPMLLASTRATDTRDSAVSINSECQRVLIALGLRVQITRKLSVYGDTGVPIAQYVDASGTAVAGGASAVQAATELRVLSLIGNSSCAGIKVGPGPLAATKTMKTTGGRFLHSHHVPIFNQATQKEAGG